MASNRCMAIMGAALLGLAPRGLTQPASAWRVYKLADGLPESGCVSVSLSPQGNVLAKHLSMPVVSQLDGYNVTIFPCPEGSSRVYGSPGGQLWTVTAMGLEELKEGSWSLHRLPQIAMQPVVGRPNDPVPLYPVRQGLVLCLLPDALLEFNSGVQPPQAKVLRSSKETQLGAFSSMTAARDGGLWLAGARGVAKVPASLRNLRPETVWQEHLLPESLGVRNLQDIHEDPTTGVVAVGEAATNHERMLVYFDGEKWRAEGAGQQRIRLAWRGADRTWWAATIGGLFHSETERAELVENEEISARQYFDVALEPGGAFWLATSDGLFRYAPLTWRMATSGRSSGSLIRCLAEDTQGRIWFIAGRSLCVIEGEQFQEVQIGRSGGAEVENAEQMFALKNGRLLFQTEDKLLEFNPVSGTIEPGPRNDGQPPRAVGTLRDGRVCLQSISSGAGTNLEMEAFDGRHRQPLSWPAPEVGFGKALSAVYEAQNGDLWLGAEHGTAWCHLQKWRTFVSTDKAGPEAPVGFAELPDGKIWCATLDRLWQFDGHDWSEVRGGFDRINCLLRTPRDGSVWVGSNNGLHRFSQGGWVENGREEGLPSANVRVLYEDQRGRVWAGTTHGLSLYHPEADRDAPQTQVQRLSEKEKRIGENAVLTLVFGGEDRWKFTPRERLLYSYRLDGQEWSGFQEGTRATFMDLPAGKHYFEVRAMDRNGNVDPKPPQLEFAVILPWYRETRLMLVSLGGLGIALFFAGLAFNRHRQLVRSYAVVEKKVAERTRELELTSRELVHSQKMNALGTLAAGIAHDFNNILSIIKGSAQLIEDNLDHPEKVRLRLERINTVVEQGSGIVKAMLGFTRESERGTVPCDINAAVEDTVKLLGDRFLREIQVSFEPGKELPPVNCAKDFLQQILLNFIFNAAESMDGHKQIILGTRKMDKLPGGLVLAPAAAESFLEVSVKDFGCGIPVENMARIFEPFFTTKALSARRGTGLGLSMVYELARKLEAGLSVESTVGKGSKFALILPVHANGS